MKYRHMDGFKFEADNPKQACGILWRSMFIPDDTIEEWITGSAERAKAYNGAEIRTDSFEHHFEDLIRTGFIIPEEE